MPQKSNKLLIPVLPLRDVVVYPHMVVPLFVGREKSIAALDAAMEGNKLVFLVAQQDSIENNPSADDIFEVGTISNILQLLKLPDGTVKVLIEGIERGEVKKFTFVEPYFCVELKKFTKKKLDDRESEVLCRSLLSQFERYTKLNKKISPEIISSISNISDVSRFVDTISAHMPLKISEKQEILTIKLVKSRIERLMVIIESEIDLLQMNKKIDSNIKQQMEKGQREYFLHEKIKAIQKELGDLGDDGLSEIDTLLKKAKNSGMHKEAFEKVNTEIKKLKSMSPMAAEATVCRNYIEWMLDMPWQTKTKVRVNLSKAGEILNSEHYGLEEIKERILEYLAVQQRVKIPKVPVLCLVGPPGVGKTSLGESIAKSTGRKFVRISLGGVRDEAEIRGHRRTYIGAMPGKILQKLAKVKVRNPLFLLDEIDKMATDFRGDPAAALLEVLDPEQNNTFNDHYLEVDYDLSEVMFIATSNSLDIPEPLLDRMEVIRISGYTEDEKMNIAKNYLLPKQLKNHGLKNIEVKVTDIAMREIIRYYTREAGVRNLEREISKLYRKVVKKLLLNKSVKDYSIEANNLEKYLGVPKYRYSEICEEDSIGQVIGLAWTQVGGEILTIEAVGIQGKGKLIRTGKLGAVMQESIQAAITVVRSRSNVLGIKYDAYKEIDIHVHVPEGATPKDGPSAGIGMCIAMASMLTRIPVKRDVAMTGEITLKGQVLPIGGLKEKLLAARRAGIKMVIIPNDNIRDLKEISDNIYEGMEITPVRWIDEIFPLAFVYKPVPLTINNDFAIIENNSNNKKNNEASKH